MRKLILILICLIFWVTYSWSQEAEEGKETVAEQQANYWQEVQKFYEKSMKMSEKGSDWVKEDIKRIGDWEYKIVTLNAEDVDLLTEELNKLGQLRWEVYWVQDQGKQIRFFFKRSARTYIKHIPVGDMWRLLPKAEGE